MKGLCAPIRPQEGGPVVAAPRLIPGAARGDPSQPNSPSLCVGELSALLGAPNGAPVPSGSHWWQHPTGWGLSPHAASPHPVFFASPSVLRMGLVLT